MEESKKTEGKWRAFPFNENDYFKEGFYFIENAKGSSICDIPMNYDNAKANADFIVKAVNNHDGLVEALESIAKYLHTQDSIEAECALMEAMTVLNEVEEKE